MKRYETIFISDPDLSDEGRAPLFDRVKDLITQHDGFLVKMDTWGTRKLAYDIKRKTRGYYTLVDFCGAGDLVSELERFFRIDDRVLKFMSVMLAEKVDLDEIRREMAEAASKTTADEGPKASETTAFEAQDTSALDTEEEA
jgi:small subunit ribosomal protein S6